MDPGRAARHVDAVALLADPVRERLYAYIAERDNDVTRDEAAEAVGISRALAAFHLDKLAKGGLVETSFRRLTGRSGPGAGRPAKLYRRADRRFEVTIPPRRHELLAELLAGVVAATGPARGEFPDSRLTDSLRERARALGIRAGSRARAGRGPRPRRRVEQLLRELGYQPRPSAAGEITLGNCPFDPVSREFPDVVCRMNVEMIDAALRALHIGDLRASREPDPRRCCVVLRRDA